MATGDRGGGRAATGREAERRVLERLLHRAGVQGEVEDCGEGYAVRVRGLDAARGVEVARALVAARRRRLQVLRERPAQPLQVGNAGALLQAGRQGRSRLPVWSAVALVLALGLAAVGAWSIVGP